jgi:hypothetical protein
MKMANTSERMQILKMIEQGKISAADGAELLRALDHTESSASRTPLKGASAPRWFRVRVTDMNTGRNKINVNIPMGLVNVGIKMGARFVPEMEGGEYEDLLQAIKSGEQGKVADVVNGEEGERIEIFLE